MGVRSIRTGKPRPQRPRTSRKYASPLDRARSHEVIWSQVAPLFDAARQLSDPKFVYLIGYEDGPLKIGVAKDPVARLRGMQTGTPYPLRVEHVVVGDRSVEKMLHRYWEPHAIVSAANQPKVSAPPGTEWFRPDVRWRLVPIIETAIAQQIALLEGASCEPASVEFERAVQEGHIEHDFVLRQLDDAPTLARGAGYRISRTERLSAS